MNWRDKLQKASFRKAEFFVGRAETEEGRRGVLHEYPQRDDPFVEDLGRKAGEFSLEAIVIGPDYFSARDRLREALKAPGPGELVHPTLGRLQVALTGPVRFVEELVDAGGMCRFSLRFTETAVNTEPAARTDTAAVVDMAADTAVLAVADQFAQDFSVAGLPEFAVADARALLDEALAALDAARAGLLPDLSVAGAFVAELNRVSASLTGLIGTPAALAGQVMGLVAGLAGAISRPLAAFSGLQKLFGYTSPAVKPPAATPVRQQQAANRNAIETLVARAVVIEAARVAAVIDFTPAPRTFLPSPFVGEGSGERDSARAAVITYREAATLRESLAEALEDAAATARMPVWNALMDLRAAAVRDITARGADLPRLSTINLPTTLPALVAAYRAFGDARREAEIVARNRGRVRHPGFVPGGVPLEVLA
ncbi:MAG: DNA circularization N-terminal domain-containing protein [Azonexus sp.]|jgi:prophage DNA circulation protein|nr:DNA circularization N-terminal domain-containing protein [Azonexus sp.]